MSRRRTDKTMKVNILVDYEENGIDKNEVHIVWFAENETAAAAKLLESLTCKGYNVQSMIAVDGDYTLAELHDMANYGVGFELNKCRLLYMSHECMEYIARVKRDPEEARKLQEEMGRRKEALKGQQSGY